LTGALAADRTAADGLLLRNRVEGVLLRGMTLEDIRDIAALIADNIQFAARSSELEAGECQGRGRRAAGAESLGVERRRQHQPDHRPSGQVDAVRHHVPRDRRLSASVATIVEVGVLRL
jgi:hypothetical protein